MQQQASAQASVFRQSLVRSHGKDESISSVYNLPHKDEKSAVLGSGATSTVRIIEHKVTGTKYALKTIKLNRVAKAELKALFKEVEIMKKLDHPNIIRVVETFKDFNNLHIIMEMCTGGELFDKLYDQPKNRFEEKKCRELVIKMLSSLHYLHEAGIVHRDLKLENFIFTSKDSDAEIKLIDFGLSRGYLEGTHMRQFVGTPYYMAPEVIKGDYTSACDMWESSCT